MIPVIYVATNGNDTWSGSLPDSNEDRTDGPLATLARAVEASRQVGPAYWRRHTPRRIVVRGGLYEDVSVSLDARDTALIIEAAGGESPILCGGHRITGWREEGQFWVADLPGVTEGKWDPRMLEMNGRFCDRARLPESGAPGGDTFTHESVFDVRWMSTTLGGWERPPTDEELTTLKYKEGDLGPWIEPRNAELTIYHHWDDSMVGVASIDHETRTVHFSAPAGHPAGSFGNHVPKARTYVVWNVREGMTRPGQWYLDRAGGRAVYWPLPGEVLDDAVAFMPTTQVILRIATADGAAVEGLVVRGLQLKTTTTPLIAGDFAATRLTGAITGDTPLINCTFENLKISNVAGHGIKLQAHWNRGIRIAGCEVDHTGAGGIYIRCDAAVTTENLVQHVGLMYPAAIGIFAGGDGYEISHNDVYDTSYTAINGGGGKGSRIEYNDMARAMQVLNDGAAIYVIFAEDLLVRGNIAREIRGGTGGRHAYYLDEQSEHCVVTGNLAVGVPSSAQNHWARHNRIEHNVFINDGDVILHFPRSEDYTIARNVIWASGKIQFRNVGAIARFEANIFYAGGGTIEGVQYQGGQYREGQTVAIEPGDDLVNADPLFVDAAGGDYRFRPGSPALALGIEPIDVSKAGRTRR